MTLTEAAPTAAAPGARRLLFARNLFLPRDFGGNRYPYEVVRRLGARGNGVTVLTPHHGTPFPPLNGVRYRHYPVSRRHPFATHLTNVAAAWIALRGRAAQTAETLLVGSYDVALAVALLPAPRPPMVFFFHSEFYSEWVTTLESGPRRMLGRVVRAYMGLVERRVFEASARIVAVSRFSADQIATRDRVAAAKVRVVPTGVDTRFFTPPADRAAAKRAVSVPEDTLLLLGVGRLVGVKQFDRLIEGVASARRAGLDARLVLAGSGPDQPDLEALAARQGVAEQVRFDGYQDQHRLRALMQAADLQVCSSKFENFSLAILEGMACGTPVLGTPGGGTPELVAPVSPALVLEDDRAETIGGALLALSREPAELAELGRRARTLVAERYDWERVVDGLERVIDEVRGA